MKIWLINLLRSNCFDFFTAFRLNFKSIFLSSFAVTLVAIIYSLLVTPIFSSTALITLNKDNSQGSQTSGSYQY